MRLTVLGLLALAAVALAEHESDWLEEDEEDPYNDQLEDIVDHRQRVADTYDRRRRETYDEFEDDPREYRERTRREAYVEEPYEEHVRVKRRCEDEARDAGRRVPRQVHQYEVYEPSDEGAAPGPSYEEMLAASAEHYHRVYAGPGAPAPDRYAGPDVSHPTPHAFVSSNVPYASVPSVSHAPLAQKQPGPLNISPFSVQYLKQIEKPSPHAPPHLPHVAQPAIQLQQTPMVGSPLKSVPFVRSPVKTIPLVRSPLKSMSGSPGKAAQQLAKQVFGEQAVQFVGPPVGHVGGKAALAEEAPLAAEGLRALADQTPAGGHHHRQHAAHSHADSSGGGHHKHDRHHNAHGGKSIKGFNNHQYLDKGAKGSKTDEHHRKEYEESDGQKKKHHDKAAHKAGHQEEANGHRGAHFDEKKGHKKGHKTKGYHNKYHKDEFHKEHKFYDDFHKSGEHHRYGKFNAKHASNESGKKKAHHVNAGHDYVERGKKGYSNKGHLDKDHKGYKGKHGHEEHHEAHDEHGKKGGSEGGKKWGYSKKN